ncbi:MAG: hypothetical protein WD068_01840 [Candidatus Babeliales bacterium]
MALKSGLKLRKRNAMMLLLIIMALLVVGVWYTYKRYYALSVEQHRITVFIHGTFFTSLSAVSIKSVLQDELDESSWYVRMMRSVRKETMLLQDQVISEEGLFEVSPEQIKACHNCDLSQDDKKFGASFIVDAYDRVARTVNQYGDFNRYYSFGWSGLLSHKKRIDAARTLYNQLIQLIQNYEKKFGVKPEITLVAHSHGGNVAKLLVQIERELDKNLRIKHLVMYGTPIQSETAELVDNEVIETCISCYSDGDNVQGNDIFSSRDRTSKKKLSEIVSLVAFNSSEKRRVDVRLIYNDNPAQIGHMNMWFMGRAEKLFESLDPLPLMVLTPLIIQEIDRCRDVNDIDLHFTEARGLLTAHICPYGQRDIKCWSDNLFHVCLPASLYARTNWNPGDKNRSVMFNLRNYTALKKAWFGE